MANDVQINVKVNDQASGEMKNIAQSHEESMRKMRDEFNKTIRDMDTAKYNESLAKLKYGSSSNVGLVKQNESISKQMQLQREKIDVLNRSLNEAKKTYGDSSREADKYAKSIQKANLELERLNNKFTSNNDRMKLNILADNTGKLDKSKLLYDNAQAQRVLGLSGLKEGTEQYYKKALDSLTPVMARQRLVVDEANKAHQMAVQLYGAESTQALRRLQILTSERQAYQNLSKEMKGLAKSHRDLSAGGWENAIMGGAVAAAATMKTALQKAINSIETKNRINIFLGSDAAQSRGWAQNFGDPLHLSQTALLNNQSKLFMILNSTQMSREMALKESQLLTERAYDMSSLYQMPVDEIMGKIISGLNGMARPLQELGINMKDENVKQYAVQSGIAKSGESLSDLQLIQARIGYLKEYSSDALGDLKRTMDSPANMQRRAETEQNIMLANLGQALIPRYTELLSATNSLLGSVNSSNSLIKQLTTSFMTLSAETLAVMGAFKALKFIIPTQYGTKFDSISNIAIKTVGTIAVLKEIGDFMNDSIKEKENYNLGSEITYDMFDKMQVKKDASPVSGDFFGISSAIAAKLGINNRMYREGDFEEKQAQIQYKKSLAETREEMIKEYRESGDPFKMIQAEKGEVDKLELTDRTKIKTDKEYAEIRSKKKAEEEKSELEKIEQQKRQEKEQEDAVKKPLIKELFNLQHQGAYSNASDNMAIAMRELEERKKEAEKTLGSGAGVYFDKIQAEQIRIENDRIRKLTEEAYDSIYDITHSTIEKQLHDIDRRKQANIRAGMAEKDAAIIAEAEKRKIINQANEELIGMSVKVDFNKSDYQKQLYDIEMERLQMEEKFGKKSAEITQLYEKKKTSLMVNETKSRIDSVQNLMTGTMGGVINRAKELAKQNGGSANHYLNQALQERDQEQKDDAYLWGDLAKRLKVDPRDSDYRYQIESLNRNKYFDKMFGIDSNDLVRGKDHFDFSNEDSGINSLIDSIERNREELRASITLNVTFDEEGNARLKNAIANDVADRLDVSIS